MQYVYRCYTGLLSAAVMHVMFANAILGSFSAAIMRVEVYGCSSGSLLAAVMQRQCMYDALAYIRYYK